MIAEQGTTTDENTREQYCRLPFTLTSGTIALSAVDPKAKCEFTTVEDTDIVMTETDFSVKMTYTDSTVYSKDDSLKQAQAMDELLKNVDLYVTA